MCICVCGHHFTATSIRFLYVCTQAEYRGFVCSLFVEGLDLLVASALDGNICEMGGKAVHAYTFETQSNVKYIWVLQHVA